MTPKLFTALGLAALASLVTAALVQSSFGTVSSGRTEGQPLLPALPQLVTDMTAVELRQGDKSLTLQKQAAGWTIKERSGFPAKPDKVRALMVQLGQAELIEKKTLNPARYGVIELEDPTLKDAKSREVRILGKSDKPIADIILGKKKYEAFGAGKSGTYVRKADDKQTWLASGDLDAPLDVKEWVDRGVIDIGAAKITRVSVVNPGGETLTFARTPPPAATKPAEPAASADAPKPAMPGVNFSKPDDPKANDAKSTEPAPFAFLELPAGKKLKDGVTADAVPKSFSGIELDDVRKMSDTPAKDNIATVKIETSDGMTVNLQLRKEGGDSWLSLTATGSDKSAETATALTQRAQGWEFKIPSWKADAITKKKTDLIDDKPA